MKSILRQAWRERAACQGHSPALWFPEGHTPADATDIALDICHSCPVQTQCLEHALATPEHHGIWGGLTETERKLRHGRARCGTTAGFARHRAIGSEPCRPCRDATNAYKRDRAATRRTS